MPLCVEPPRRAGRFSHSCVQGRSLRALDAAARPRTKVREMTLVRMRQGVVDRLSVLLGAAARNRIEHLQNRPNPPPRRQHTEALPEWISAANAIAASARRQARFMPDSRPHGVERVDDQILDLKPDPGSATAPRFATR